MSIMLTLLRLRDVVHVISIAGNRPHYSEVLTCNVVMCSG